MSELRENLVSQLQAYQGRNSLGAMKTEISVFIPLELLHNQSDDVRDFILLSKEINGAKDKWHCNVSSESHDSPNSLMKGVEFLFEVSPSTHITAIIDHIKSK